MSSLTAPDLAEPAISATNSEVPPPLTLHSAATPPFAEDQRGNGKVARLPKVLRDQVNLMLEDGLPYKAIIARLEQSTQPPLPYPLSEMNISRWKDHGYQDYLRQQEWRAQMRDAREYAAELEPSPDEAKFHQTVIQVGLTEIFLSLRQGSLKEDPGQYTRMLNSLARLSREALVLRKYSDEQSKQKAEIEAHISPNRDAQKDRDILVSALQNAMNCNASPGPIGPDINLRLSPQIPPDNGNPSPAETLSETSSQPLSQPLSNPLSNPLSKTSSATLSNPSSETSSPPQPPTPTQPIPPPDRCHFCHSPLPPLLPDGQRPFSSCQKCHTALRPPDTLHLYCRSCQARLAVIDDEVHLLKRCPHCLVPISPPQ